MRHTRTHLDLHPCFSQTYCTWLVQVERLNNRIYEHAGEIEDLKYKAELQLQEQMYIMSYVAQRRKLAYADSEAPAAEEIREYASYLGIDPELDAKWLWIAEEAISCPLPPSWEGMQDDNGAPFFYNKQVRSRPLVYVRNMCIVRISRLSLLRRRTRVSTLIPWTNISARCLPTSNRYELAASVVATACLRAGGRRTHTDGNVSMCRLGQDMARSARKSCAQKICAWRRNSRKSRL